MIHLIMVGIRQISLQRTSNLKFTCLYSYGIYLSLYLAYMQPLKTSALKFFYFVSIHHCTLLPKCYIWQKNILKSNFL